ncbi:MAG: tetratricopeptide repeat protein [bacterium]
MAAKRLTRKEMVRQDRIQQTLTETSGWLVRNLSYILAAVAIVLVSLAAVYLWTSYQESVESELQTKFSDALAKYHATVTEEVLEDSSNNQPPQDPATKYEFATTQERSESALAAFKELSEEYSGLRLGALSKYYMGLTLMDLEKPDEAKSVLSSVISDSEFPDISNLARNSLVQLAVSEGNEKEAIRLLKEILDKPSLNFPEQLALTRLAQSYEAVGEHEEALRTYRKLSAEYAGTSFANKSDARIEYLELRGVTIEEEEPGEEIESSETPE